MAPVPWPAAASLLAAVGTVFLIRYLLRYRGKPGADWFLASLSAQTVWSVAYGVALLVTDPAVRWALEATVWVAMAATSVCFLAFALAYTGRSGVVREYRALFLVVPVVMGVVVVGNPVHGLAWTDFGLAPVGGLSTVSYSMRGWFLAAAAVGILLVPVGSLLLFDTVVSYGPLYRGEAVAVGLSTVPPVVALYVWLAGAGPVPQLNLATTMFLPHVALDAYAFVGSDMFEFHPATRRAGERAAIDDLGAPVVIVDERERVVTLNDAAQAGFDVEKSAALTRPLADLFDDDLDPTADGATVTVQEGGRRTVYSVTSTRLTDAGGTDVGYTLVFQDVTAERRREQRLNVLNRVIRHNLRNDMTVVQGFTEAAAERVDDDGVRDMLDRARRKAEGLVALGDNARAVERVLDGDEQTERVDVAALLERVVADRVEDAAAEDAAVTVESGEVAATTDPSVLESVVGALVDNALAHAGEAPAVELAAERRDDRVTVTVADDGPGIPEGELAVIDAGTESQLEHGSGLGLWLANWGATELGGDLSVETTDGTTARVSFPADRE